jgi:Macrocin-O-methyltransferase (TylF)
MASLPSASQRVYVQEYTMVSARRLTALERSIRTVVRNGIPGEIVECGTARGGSAALLALWLKRLQTNRKIYVFDTFEGLPAPTLADPDYGRAVQFTGLCRGQLDEVENLFTSLGVRDFAVFVKGLFQDTMPGFPFPEKIALAHLDADWYDSTMVCLNHLWDRIPVGGIVQFDDYGSWQGCKKAVDEFFTTRGITDRLHCIDRDGRYVVKTGASR